MVLQRGQREHLPERRAGYTQKVLIGGQKVFLRTGEYPDGRLGEVFLDASKTGMALHSMINANAILISLALQYGCPLEQLVEAFRGFRFDPSGDVVGDPRIPQAASLLDYVFHELELTYLKGELPPAPETREESTDAL